MFKFNYSVTIDELIDLLSVVKNYFPHDIYQLYSTVQLAKLVVETSLY